MSRKKPKPAASQTVRLAWRASRPGLAVIVFFSACINLLKLAMPLYLIAVLDRVPASRSIETLVMLTIVALLAVMAGLALETVRRRMLSRWGIWIEQQLGPPLFERGLGAASPGQTMSVGQSLDDLAILRSFVSSDAAAWIDIVWAPFFIFGAYLVHPIFAILGSSAVGLLLLLGVLQERTTRTGRRAARQATANASDIVVAAERNIESVGALTMTPNLADRWRREMAMRGAERERTEGKIALFGFLRNSLRQFLYIGSVGVGVWLVLHGALTLGAIFAARIMLGFGYRLVDRPMSSWRSLREAQAAYLSVRQRLAIQDRPAASVGEVTQGAALVLDNVTYRYQDQRDSIFRGLSLTLEPGEALLVTGPATAGKSTLSRLLVGVIEPRYGQVRLGDIEIVRLPSEMRAELIGYLPQHTELFRGTIRENIARMGRGDFEAVVAAAKLVDIHDMIVRLPQGYDTEISGEAVGLSGSERKRIAIARAICGRPRLLVLDEPSANLDRASRRTLEAAIVELKKQGCSVVVTQAMNSSRMSGIAEKFLLLGGRAPEFSVGPDLAERQPEGGAKPGLRSVK